MCIYLLQMAYYVIFAQYIVGFCEVGLLLHMYADSSLKYLFTYKILFHLNIPRCHFSPNRFCFNVVSDEMIIKKATEIHVLKINSTLDHFRSNDIVLPYNNFKAL